MTVGPLTASFAARLVLEAEDAGDTQAPRRILAGVAVPWDEVGMTSLGPARFERGALDVAGRLPPLVRDHDGTRVAGVVVSAVDGDDGVTVRARVSRTPTGDETLTLADDGALSGFSVSVLPTVYRFEADERYGDVLVVSAGEWRELSVVAFPAFDTARIADVAASAAHNHGGTAVTMTEPVAATAALELPIPTAPVVPVIAARPRVPALNAGQVAQLMWTAQAGDVRAAQLLEDVIAAQPATAYTLLAALTSETTTTSAGIVPPAYTSELLDGLPVATPFVSNCVRRSSLPATGMSIVKPQWTTVPAGAWVATENAAAPTSAATIGSKSVAVLTYAHAVLASLNLVNRSAFGGYANAYYEQAGIDYLAKKEAKAVAVAQGAATAVALTGETTVPGAIGVLVAAAVAQQTLAGGPDGPEFRGLLPEYAAIAPNLWSALVETGVMQGPAFSSGDIRWGTLSGNLSGLQVFAVPSLAAGKMLVGARAAVVLHDESEVNLSAVVVNTLSVELGIMGNCAVDAEYPKALVKSSAAFTPTGTLVAADEDTGEALTAKRK